MDPLYVSERDSRKRLWDALLRLNEENRRSPAKRIKEDVLRQPLTIVQVERDQESDCSELLEISYLYNPDDDSGNWLCTFCGMNVRDHSWSSFDSTEDGVVVPRWKPAFCTLHKLLDRISQDFFPGLKVSLDMETSHLSDQINLNFNELDELSSILSTTRIKLLKRKPENESVPAMDVGQQLAELKGWLEICERDSAEDGEDIHEQCQENKNPTISAKRVLDLANATKGTVRVVESANRKGRYVALSHCWGDPKRHPLMSTHATLENHMSGIAVSSLPRSFRDAITVCLYLNVQFLWIDCLCIVQDDSAEWLAEAEKMAAIYSDSYLTIAAARAQNSQQGFLFDFPDDTVHYEIMADAPWDKDRPNRALYGAFQIDHEYSKSYSTPLNGRAWCLQEWYLPKRLAEFCLNDIRLLCLRRVETRFGRTNDEQTWTRTIARGFGLGREDGARKLWENIRGDFFGRSITKTSDRLPAIAGLAQMLEGRIYGVKNHRYLAGLWTTRISEDLSWSVLDYDDETEAIEGIPSWSWASTSTSSDYIYGRPSHTFVELVGANCTGYARPKEISASLKIKGFVASLYLRVDHQHEDYAGRPSMSFWFNDGMAVATTTEEIEANAKGKKTSSVVVLDMPICPPPHNHDTGSSANHSHLCQVQSISRASKDQEKCNNCMEKCYVSPIHLLLLTKTDVSMTALVLATVSSSSPLKGKESGGKDAGEVYQRLGLLEMDCIRTIPWMETADGFKVPADAFWQIKNMDARRVINIV